MATTTSPPPFNPITLRSSSLTKLPPHPTKRLLALPISSSPFTEISSSDRYPRDSWAYPIAKPSRVSDNENDIGLQLPDLRQLLNRFKEDRGGRSPGIVALVGTGPGDPELMTVKAVRAIEKADLILYDRLVSNDVLDLVPGNARLLYVGKTAGYHSRTQEEIHELLLSFAEAGANVVRLKGGDPLVFGRGGEEMDFLQKQGIKIIVIPGITSASGIAAELAIPLTYRGIANSVRFLTGHSRNGGTDPLHVTEHAADPESTLVIYMGLSTLPGLTTKLMNYGLSPKTPAVAVERGTTPLQQNVFAELKDLVSEVRLAKLVSPTLIIIGGVVSLSPLWHRSSEEDLAMHMHQAA